uniref:sigma-70 family RNA polymerase sigma factor n=1 Tax=Actinokineospora spheciospongiae TaxID=909613 RepID=UPI000D71975E
MSTVPAGLEGPSDAELIEAVRDGRTAAYGPLYERHVGAARNLARQLARSSVEADDLVSEAFAKVLATLRQGRGPDSAFRAYLLTALRHTAYDKTRRDRRVDLVDDVTQASGVNPEAVSVPFADTAVEGLERTLAARAFRTLPERWQAVLWHTEIEGQSPAQVAPVLGLTPNGVSALAYRAREGLRQAYLQVHLASTSDEHCHATAERLGTWVRGGLAKRETAQVEAHLDECDRCRALAAELADVNGGLRAGVAPLVLGPLAVAAYLSGSATTGLTAAGGAAAAAAGAANAASGSAAAAAGAAAGGAATGAGGAGGAAAGSAVRQGVVASVSAAAVAAAVVAGLLAGPSGQQVPLADEPVAEAPAPTPAPPVPPAPPAPPAPADPPAPRPPAADPPAPPAAETPAPPPPPAPAPAPVPNPPQAPPPAPTPVLDAAGPVAPPVLVPGRPADIVMTVRNTGGRTSGPVTAVLRLPQGVRAVAERALAVRCPGGAGTITCTGAGIPPGETASFSFTVVADPGARDGVITGSVTAEGVAPTSFSIPVRVAPPALKDAVRVLAAPRPGFPHGEPALDVRVLNTGESSEPVTISFDRLVHRVTSATPVDCTRAHERSTCTTRGPLAPGSTLALVAYTHPPGWEDRSITVTAVLGTAKDSAVAWIPWWSWSVPTNRSDRTPEPGSGTPGVHPG